MHAKLKDHFGGGQVDEVIALLQTYAVVEMGKLAVETGIPDLATNVDNYLYNHSYAS